MYLIVQGFGHLICRHIIIGVPHTLAKLANGYNLRIPPWLLISVRSSHFCHCSVYNILFR